MGFDIGAAIISALNKKLLIKGGGHKMAGGFSIETNKINEFKKFIIKKYNNKVDKSFRKNCLYLDSSISASAINLNFYEKIDKLSPFGSGNPEPKFLLEKMKVLKSSVVGERHIKSISRNNI